MEEDVRRLSLGLESLFSGVVGALAVALITIGYRETREARQRVAERVGLARLLIQEVEHNEKVVEVFETRDKEEPAEIYVYVRNPPRTDAWIETRARFAQLLPKYEDFAVLTDYFGVLHSLVHQAEHAPPPDPDSWGSDERFIIRTVPSRWPNWQRATEDVKARLRQWG